MLAVPEWRVAGGGWERGRERFPRVSFPTRHPPPATRFPILPPASRLRLLSLVRLLLPRPPGDVPPSGPSQKEVFVVKRYALVALVLMVAFLTAPVFASPVPSKTVANQSI